MTPWLATIQHAGEPRLQHDTETGWKYANSKTLLVLMREYGLVELEIEDKKGKVRLVRGGGRASVDETESGSEAHVAARAASPIKMATRQSRRPRKKARGRPAKSISRRIRN